VGAGEIFLQIITTAQLYLHGRVAIVLATQGDRDLAAEFAKALDFGLANSLSADAHRTTDLIQCLLGAADSVQATHELCLTRRFILELLHGLLADLGYVLREARGEIIAVGQASNALEQTGAELFEALRNR